jgi:hypothetical protein
MTEDLTIPASYDVWLTDLKHHLDRTTGSKAALARYLSECRSIKLPSAKVKVSELLSQRYMPGADLFFDIAIWLQQQQQDEAGETVRLERADEPEPIGPRREVFGLNIPSSPRAPAHASQLVLSLAGTGQILAEWVRGVRSSNNRVLIQILGVDAGYREYSKSGNVTDELIKGLPAGSTVKVKIIALNGSLEAASGPEAQITLP